MDMRLKPLDEQRLKFIMMCGSVNNVSWILIYMGYSCTIQSICH